MEVTKRIELDYGHTLPKHYSFCSQIHGHRAYIDATVEGTMLNKENDSSQGMVLDFKFMKDIMMKYIHDVLDHGFAVWEKDEADKEFILKRNTKVLLTNDPPTAECLAKWAFNQLYDKIPKGLQLKNIRWYETPTSYAEYNIDNKNNGE